jgi:hypothetical protein
MNAEPSFNAAYQAFDFSSHAGSVGLSLLTVWGALEQLFAQVKQELRFRISASIACYLENHGPERLHLHKRIQKLYDARSTAAHNTTKVEQQELVDMAVGGVRISVHFPSVGQFRRRCLRNPTRRIGRHRLSNLRSVLFSVSISCSPHRNVERSAVSAMLRLKRKTGQFCPRAGGHDFQFHRYLPLPEGKA